MCLCFPPCGLRWRWNHPAERRRKIKQAYTKKWKSKMEGDCYLGAQWPRASCLCGQPVKVISELVELKSFHWRSGPGKKGQERKPHWGPQEGNLPGRNIPLLPLLFLPPLTVNFWQQNISSNTSYSEWKYQCTAVMMKFNPYQSNYSEIPCAIYLNTFTEKPTNIKRRRKGQLFCEHTQDILKYWYLQKWGHLSDTERTGWPPNNTHPF